MAAVHILVQPTHLVPSTCVLSPPRPAQTTAAIQTCGRPQDVITSGYQLLFRASPPSDFRCLSCNQLLQKHPIVESVTKVKGPSPTSKETKKDMVSCSYLQTETTFATMQARMETLGTERLAFDYDISRLVAARAIVELELTQGTYSGYELKYKGRAPPVPIRAQVISLPTWDKRSPEQAQWTLRLMDAIDTAEPCWSQSWPQHSSHVQWNAGTWCTFRSSGYSNKWLEESQTFAVVERPWLRWTALAPQAEWILFAPSSSERDITPMVSSTSSLVLSPQPKTTKSKLTKTLEDVDMKSFPQLVRQYQQPWLSFPPVAPPSSPDLASTDLATSNIVTRNRIPAVDTITLNLSLDSIRRTLKYL